MLSAHGRMLADIRSDCHEKQAKTIGAIYVNYAESYGVALGKYDALAYRVERLLKALESNDFEQVRHYADNIQANFDRLESDYKSLESPFCDSEGVA